MTSFSDEVEAEVATEATIRAIVGQARVVIDSGSIGSTDLSRRGSTRAEDAEGTTIQSHISPSIL